MRKTLEALVLLLASRGEARTPDEVARGIILGHEAAEVPIDVRHGLDQAEDAATPIVNRDVLKTRSQARRGVQAVAAAALKRNVDAGDLIEVVENDECR